MNQAVSPSTPAIEFRNVSCRFISPEGKATVALRDFSMSVARGEFIAIVGPTGCGKSTTLNLITGLLKPVSGEVRVMGRPVDGIDPRIGFVFQADAVFPWRNVIDNVAAGPLFRGRSKDVAYAQAEEWIRKVGLDKFTKHYPHQLSGGMRKRVALAQTFINQPEILLMDEPFSALDVLTAETLRTDLLDLWTQGRMPIKSVLIVTHNIEEAVFMCDRILVLSSNPGRVIAEIKVPFKHPRNRLDPAFRKLVDDIYAKMTARQTGEATKKGLELGSWLPQVSTNLMAGLIETLAMAPYHGRADMPEIARTLHLEVDDLFPIAEVLQYLGFADVREGDVFLTPPGRVFAEFGTQERKLMFADHLLKHVPLAARIKKVLNERPGHRAPRVRFEQELEDFLSDGAAEETLDAVIDWGRYGEIFSYNDQTEIFSLEDVES
jgi:NitT/TauT family transport system ATP-binding protein